MIDITRIPESNFLGKLVRLPLKLVPRDAVVPVLQGPLRGSKWIAGAHVHRCWLGSYEPELQRRIARELEVPGVFYDVGANVGFYTLLAATRVAPNSVVAFEPLSANLQYLRRHLDLNRLTNVTVLQVAVSDREGQASFMMEPSRGMGRLQADGNERVETSTLDLLLNQDRIPPPNYIKMDIEGAEHKALLGAEQCFRKFRPKLFLATHGEEVHADCCRLLRSWNYDIETVGVQESADRAEIAATPASR